MPADSHSRQFEKYRPSAAEKDPHGYRSPDSKPKGYLFLCRFWQDGVWINSGVNWGEYSELPTNEDLDEVKKALVEKFNALIETEGGKVSEVQEWGMKRLAYPINKLEQGYYVLVNFEAKAEFITELERVYKITDEVMKFITIRKDEE